MVIIKGVAMKTILKILRYISAGIGFFFLWCAAYYLLDGLTVDIDWLGVVFVMYLPLGVLFRWLSITGKTRKQKRLDILENFLILLIIRNLISVVGHFYLSSDLWRYITNRLIASILFIILGMSGLYLIDRGPFKKHDKENVK